MTRRGTLRLLEKTVVDMVIVPAGSVAAFLRALRRRCALRATLFVGLLVAAGLASGLPPQAERAHAASQAGSGVITVTIEPAAPTVDDSISIRVAGPLSTPCYDVKSSHSTSGNEILVTVDVTPWAELCAILILGWFDVSEEIGRLPAGVYSVGVTVNVDCCFPCNPSPCNLEASFEVYPAGSPAPSPTPDAPTPTLPPPPDQPTPTPLPVLRGDANCDGIIDSIDALLVLQYHALLIESLGCPEAADANEDGSIDSVDALVILQQVASVPFEEIEIEPTGTRFPYHWVNCVYQAAYFAEPSLFVGGSFFIVIRDQSDWQRVWDYAIERGRAHPASYCHEIGAAPLLDVDFEGEMVIGLVEQYPTGGYSLTVDRLQTGSERWTLHATRTAPGRGCLVTQAFKYRYSFVKIARTHLPVNLSIELKTYDCVGDDFRTFA